jgi:hypothetical protein
MSVNNKIARLKEETKAKLKELRALATKECTRASVLLNDACQIHADAVARAQDLGIDAIPPLSSDIVERVRAMINDFPSPTKEPKVKRSPQSRRLECEHCGTLQRVPLVGDSFTCSNCKLEFAGRTPKRVRRGAIPPVVIPLMEEIMGD